MRSVSQAVVRGVLLALIVVVAAAPPPVHAAAAPSWPQVGKLYALTHDGSSVLADVSPDGRLVLYRSHVTGRDPGSLWIVDRSGAGRRELVRHGVGLAFFLPDGRSILYNTSATTFRRIDLHGRLLPGQLDLSGLSWLPSADQYAGDQPIWLPDGRLVFARGTRLVAVDPLHGRRFALGRVTIPTEGGVYSGVLLSPNGRYVAFPRFTVPDTAPTATWIEDVRTGRVIIRVPAAARRSWQPEAWWPDSRSLFLFNDFTAGESRLVVPSGRLTGVPGLTGGIQTATWSPNGSTMAFARHIMGSCMYAMSVNFFRENGGLGLINDRVIVSEAPIWTGDGRALVYTLIDHVARPCGIPGSDVWVTPLRHP